MDDQFSTQIKAKMLKVLEITKADLATIRTGRATPALIEHIEISAYGGSQKMKVREMATITSADAQTLAVHPYDPSTREELVKGIISTNIGLTPVAEGEMIRISIPPLSQERRQEYLKLVHAKLEAGKIMIRQVRHDEMAKLKRQYEAKEVGEDDKKRMEKQIQDVTDTMIAELESLGEMKEKELMQI